MTDPSTHEEQVLAERLHHLAHGVPAPEPLPDADLSRGRRRRTRRRLAVGAGALATGAVIALVASLAPGTQSAAPTPKPPPVAGDTATPDPAPDVTPPAEDGERVLPMVSGRSGHDGAPGALLGPDHSDTIRGYHRVLAEHLDPAGDHLEAYREARGNEQVSATGEVTTSLGSKFVWRNDGETGLGMLQVSVDAGWGQLAWPCGEDWQCSALEVPGSPRARTATYDGGTVVAVEHPDGQVVTLSADTLFGNNSTIAISGLGLTRDDLVEAALDERLTLPGDLPPIPRSIDAEQFASVGERTLVRGDEQWADEAVRGPGELWATGQWQRGADAGELAWDAQPLVGPVGEPECGDFQFQRCLERTVDGVTVFIGYELNKWGGGVQVIRTGPSYEVRVMFDDRDYPLDRAVGFVLDDRWQPGPVD